jgi:hypothetical protein
MLPSLSPMYIHVCCVVEVFESNTKPEMAKEAACIVGEERRQKLLLWQLVWSVMPRRGEE